MAKQLPLYKRAFYIAAALVVTALVAFGALEVLVRVYAPQPEPMRWLTPHPRYGHVMKPDFHQRFSFAGTDYVMEVRTNSLGFRDQEGEAEAPDTETVVFLGDSFTFGFGVDLDQRFDEVLAQKLNETEYRLINLGTPAWGTLQATRYLLDRLQEFDPDIVVLTFCANDPSDDAYFRKKGQSFDAVMFPGKRFLRNHSHLFRYATHQAFRLLHTYFVRRGQQANAGANVDTQAGVLITDEQWQSTFGVLNEFVERLRNHNPEIRLIIQATNPFHDEIHHHLSEFAERPNVTFVDLGRWTESLGPADIRLSFDGHWNPLMHAISAEALYETLEGL